jgi:hypothetical protein
MQDLKAQRDQSLANAADCELIASLATDPRKRATFERLACRLRQLALDIEQEIAAREALDAAEITLADRLSQRDLQDAVA